MATVRMVKNGKYADIFDSEVTINQAKKEGYSFVEEKKTNVDEFKKELKIDIEETEEYKKAVDVKKTSTKKK